MLNIFGFFFLVHSFVINFCFCSKKKKKKYIQNKHPSTIVFLIFFSHISLFGKWKEINTRHSLNANHCSIVHQMTSRV
ncbi:hypothetical protein DFH28DRAFT_578206 [Melampsora americana]|nr:hypothetical protein DFH28DRAFT_578206 [Melampsora americana]